MREIIVELVVARVVLRMLFLLVAPVLLLGRRAPAVDPASRSCGLNTGGVPQRLDRAEGAHDSRSA